MRLHDRAVGAALSRWERSRLEAPDYSDLTDDELRALGDEELQRALDDTDPRHLAAALDLGAVSLRMRATSAGRFGATVLRTAYLGGDPAAVSAAAWWERLS